VTRIDGIVLYNCIVSGYESVLERKKAINDINVFPVPDGDTGSNMAATFRSMTQLEGVSRSASRTLSAAADRALSGARGNSGIIIAQFVNELAVACGERDHMTTRELGSALREAAAATYRALENPREGTILTVLDAWASEMERLARVLHDAERVFLEALAAAREALARTQEQLEALRNAHVVDAGASGFVAFLEGIARMIATGKVPERAEIAREIEMDESVHALPESVETITYRYCTEALLLRAPGARDGEGATKAAIAEGLKSLGDSLVVVEGREKTKVHVHTDEPAKVMAVLRSYGRIVEQKVDNMRVQYAASSHPISKTAILTDSIADIPPDIMERYQIHVISMKILRGENEYLDRLTLTNEDFYRLLDDEGEYPGSSIPDPGRVDQAFSWLASHYDSIVAISVGRRLSGCWQVFENAAAKLRERGFPVTVVDSRLNSAAQGLAVLSAARDAEAGMGHEEIAKRLYATIARARIFVSVATLRSMVRGGRVSALKGFVATVLNLKPIVTLDSEGRGIAYGASLSQLASLRKIVALTEKKRGSISHYAVVHANAPEKAARLAADLERKLGQEPAYIVEISPVIALHAGRGAVAVAYIENEATGD
jgi:DegV family protein with EDD domain